MLTSEALRRRAWSNAMIRRSVGPIPPYGSEAFFALPELSVDRINSVICAAEMWARQGDDLEETLRLEVELSQRAFKADEDREYVDRAAEHRQRWQHLPGSAPRYAGQVVEPLEVIGRRYIEQRRVDS